MSSRIETLASTIEARFGDSLKRVPSMVGEAVYELADPSQLRDVCVELRDAQDCAFEQLIDLSAVDYLAYGRDEWQTGDATRSGFSRGVQRGAAAEPPDASSAGNRFAVAYHLLSVTYNRRLRLRAWCTPEEPPMVDSVVGVWPAANWYEREAFDLFGITFSGHSDPRRILLPDDWEGHPMRKDWVDPDFYNGMHVKPTQQMMDRALAGEEIGVGPFDTTPPNNHLD